MRTVIIEADSSIFLLIEEALKGRCDIRAFKWVSSSGQALELVKDRTDLVIFGPLYSHNISDLVVKIRSLHPEARIIKLAGTDEYKKITGEHAICGKTAEFDAIIPFSNLKALCEVIDELAG